jgi:predicted amidohydrolase
MESSMTRTAKSGRTARIAVIQLAVELGEVERNLRHIEDIVGQAAREHHPDIILLPESMTTPNVYAPEMRSVARPVDGEPYQLLRRLAREYGCMVGGGFIAVRGGDTKGTYVLAEPNGATSLHDKDEPSDWENNYYIGGTDDGICPTSLGDVGLANGYEWMRSRTARRLRGNIRLMLGGSCFPSFPSWRLTRGWFVSRENFYVAQGCREMASRMARAVGTAAAVASHVGEVTFRTPLMPFLSWPTAMPGESLIVERDGRILQRLGFEDGEGYVAADVRVADAEPLDPVGPGFWLGPLPVAQHAAWHALNAHGRIAYRLNKRAGRFPWQAWPAGDLPAHQPATEASEPAAAETNGVLAPTST